VCNYTAFCGQFLIRENEYGGSGYYGGGAAPLFRRRHDRPGKRVAGRVGANGWKAGGGLKRDRVNNRRWPETNNARRHRISEYLQAEVIGEGDNRGDDDDGGDDRFF